MPFQLNWENRHVTFTYSGKVTADDVLASNRIVYGDQRFDRLRWQIVDFDRAENLEFSRETVRRICYMDNAAALSNPNITVLFVGSSELLQEVEDAYVNAGAKPLWPVLHFLSVEEAIDHISAQAR